MLNELSLFGDAKMQGVFALCKYLRLKNEKYFFWQLFSADD
jgi:hypothetical protein